MKELLTKVRLALRASYKHILVALLAALIFFVLLFPYDDLSGLISSQIALQTRNQVQLQFESLTPTLQPLPGVKLGNVFFESTFAPSLRMEELAISPALSALMSQKARGAVTARGFLGGNVWAQASSGDPTQEGLERERLSFTLESLDLGAISDLAELPFKLGGNLSGKSVALADLNFDVQPEVDISITIEKFALPPATVETQMGPLTLPDLTLNQVQLKGRLSNGQLIIEEGAIGGAKDEVQGTVKGNIALRLVRRGQSIAPLFGAYSFDIDLTAKKPFQSRANLVFTVVDGLLGGQKDRIKRTLPDGARYALKLSGTPGSMPAFRPL